MTTTFASKLIGAAVLSAASAVASAAVVSSGVADIPGNWAFDFDTGTIGDTDGTLDIFWYQASLTSRFVKPIYGAQIVNLGVVNFAALTVTDLQGLTFSTTPIDGSDVGNQLVFGDVFAVKTTAGNYAKVIVSYPGFDLNREHGLVFYYETLSAVPEPGAAALALAGLGVMGFVAGKRRANRA
jgi:hypothetical protein